jgi:hypothetical protein
MSFGILIFLTPQKMSEPGVITGKMNNEVKSILTIVAIAKSKNTNISISENLIA